MNLTFKLETENIELFKLLKLMQVANSGGQAKLIIDDGLVMVNNQVELRKRKKIIKGDIIKFEENTIVVE